MEKTSVSAIFSLAQILRMNSQLRMKIIKELLNLHKKSMSQSPVFKLIIRALRLEQSEPIDFKVLISSAIECSKVLKNLVVY